MILAEKILLGIAFLLVIVFAGCTIYEIITNQKIPVRIIGIFWVGGPFCCLLVAGIELFKMIFGKE